MFIRKECPIIVSIYIYIYIYIYSVCSYILQALEDFAHVVLLARVWSEGKVHSDSSELNKRHFPPKHTDHM